MYFQGADTDFIQPSDMRTPQHIITTLLLVAGAFSLIMLVIASIRGFSDDTLPAEAAAFILQTEVYNPQNYFGGCQEPHRDCQGARIRRAYSITPNALPLTNHQVVSAWCAQWEVGVRHPINGNYDWQDNWVVVIQDESTYHLFTTDNGELNGTFVCS